LTTARAERILPGHEDQRCSARRSRPRRLWWIEFNCDNNITNIVGSEQPDLSSGRNN
jgi:hypothetical protein